jgi:hypothetical protein
MTTRPKWWLDSSTFINAVNIARVHLLGRVRAPIAFVEYVFRVELTGPRAREATREAARREVANGAITVERLTVGDVVRMSALSPPRRVDTGELATAVAADACGAGVLCDDHRATEWLRTALANVALWESIEHVAVDAALRSLIAEHELPEIERRLGEQKYASRFSLHAAYAQQWFQRQQAAGGAEREPSE